ncbi:excisionase Xis [Serratia marcescens]|uniref:excisionase Xis n=1 Tax=Serratia marcescens TaxID=615 RepID=UPI00351B20F3
MRDKEAWMTTKQVCSLVSVSSRTLLRMQMKPVNPFPRPDVTHAGGANRWKRWRVLAWQDAESLLSSSKPQTQGKIARDNQTLPKISPNQSHKRATKLSDEELCTLCWLWNHAAFMIGRIAEIEPLLRVAEHRLAGAYWSMAHEYVNNTNNARRILEKVTAKVRNIYFSFLGGVFQEKITKRYPAHPR